MKLNELRTAVKEAGIRPVDTAHVAEVGPCVSHGSYRRSDDGSREGAVAKRDSTAWVGTGPERIPRHSETGCAMTNDALLSVHQDDLFTLNQSSGLDAVRLAGIDATAKARREQEYRKRIIALNKKQEALKEMAMISELLQEQIERLRRMRIHIVKPATTDWQRR